MHAHDHHDDESSHADNHHLLRRIRGISVINGVVGATELVAGYMTNSSTLTMAGVHDLSDAPLYNMKHQAIREKDHARRQSLRKRGAIALMGVAFTIGGIEIARDIIEEDHQPEMSALMFVGLGAAAINAAAALTLHSHHDNEDAHDARGHVMYDLRSSGVTVLCTLASIKFPEADIAGTLAHMGFAAHAGHEALKDVKRVDQDAAHEQSPRTD